MSNRGNPELFPILVKVGRARKRYHGKYIDKSGGVAIEGPFDWVDWFFEGLACVQVGRHFGFMDSSGSWAIRPTLVGPSRFREGLARTGSYGRAGFIDQAGEIRVEPQYGTVGVFHEGRASVRNSDEEWGFVDREGNQITGLVFEMAGSFASGLAPVCMKGLWGFIDRFGDMRIAPRYDWAFPRGHREGLAPVRIGSKIGFINTEGEIVVEPKYAETLGFHEGLAWVRDELGRSFVIDTEGRVRFRTEATFMHPFRSGLSLGRTSNKCGFLDRSGSWSVEPIFDAASQFRDGLAFTVDAVEDRLAYIDMSNNIVWQGPTVDYSLEIFMPYLV